MNQRDTGSRLQGGATRRFPAVVQIPRTPEEYEDGVTPRRFRNRNVSEWDTYDVPRAPDWMRKGLCAVLTSPKFDFFDGAGEREAAVCAACPVQNTCLTYALDNKIRYGMWGGLKADARKLLEKGSA